MSDPGCGAHTGLSAEVRALAVVLLDRAEPALDRLRSGPASPPAAQGRTCAHCPVCAMLGALRGERPELAVRLADQAAVLLAVLRAALDVESPVPPTAPPDPGRTPAGRPVQRIHVDRAC